LVLLVVAGHKISLKEGGPKTMAENWGSTTHLMYEKREGGKQKVVFMRDQRCWILLFEFNDKEFKGRRTHSAVYMKKIHLQKKE